MKRIFILSFTALALFGLSAFGSWKWQQSRSNNDTRASLADSRSETDHENHDRAEETASRKGNSWSDALTKIPSLATTKTPSLEGDRPRVAIRPPYVAGVDDALKLAASLRERMNTVREREAQIAARQAQLQLIFDDIRGERTAMDELRKQLDEQLKAVEAKMVDAENRFAELALKEQELKGRVTEVDSDEKDNLKKMALIYDNMEPAASAKILHQMVDSGSMETAAKILFMMKDRQVAKVVAELPDQALAAQLLEKLKTLKYPKVAPKK